MTVGRELDDLLAEAAGVPVVGWDLSWLRERLVTAPLPWDFEEIVLRHASGSPDLLDMWTGGGERLAAMPYRPPRTVATEGWEPNVDVAGARLRPLGVTVVHVEAAPDNLHQRGAEKRGRLPFPSESFALVLNRHEAFVASEVARVLTAGGTFLTQQVGGNYDYFYDALELRRRTGSGSGWDLRLAVQQLEAAGLRLEESGEGEQTASFSDVGALAFYLKAIPWVIEGFSIETHRSRLERLHQRMKATGPITLAQPSFWLKAIKLAEE